MRWRNEGREVAATIVSEGETHYSDQDYELGFDGDRLATSSLLSASFDTVEVLVNPVDSQRLATRWDLSVEIGLAIGDGVRSEIEANDRWMSSPIFFETPIDRRRGPRST